MKYAVIALTVLLAGCTTVPVQQPFPQPVAELMTACPDLQLLDPKTTQLSVVVQTVSNNYAQYQECRIRVDAWIQWYKEQKKISDAVQ